MSPVTNSLADGVSADYAGLLRGECVFCAERLAPLPQLREESCPRCEHTLHAAAAVPGLVAELRERARKSYVYVAIAGAVAGSLAFLLPVVLTLSMLVVRLRFIRPLLRLLTPLRRLHYRLTLAGLFALLLVGTLSAVPALTMLPLFNIALGSLAVLTASALYVELGVFGLDRALRSEWVEKRPLTALHWVLPGMLLTLTVAGVSVLVLLVALGMMWFGGES